MRISDWSSDVCSSDLVGGNKKPGAAAALQIALGDQPVAGGSNRIAPQPEIGGQAAARRQAFAGGQQIGRAHVRTPVTDAHLVCRLLLVYITQEGRCPSTCPPITHTR